VCRCDRTVDRYRLGRLHAATRGDDRDAVTDSAPPNDSGRGHILRATETWSPDEADRGHDNRDRHPCRNRRDADLERREYRGKTSKLRRRRQPDSNGDTREKQQSDLPNLLRR
jgi:hypothetical protein